MRAERRSGWLLTAPYSAFLIAFAIYPIVFAVVLVFLHWDLVTAPTFAGADNVRLLATDARFWRAVANTFIFLGIHVPLQIATALALALALNRQLAGRGFWRAAFFLPVVISGAVVAILWSNLYANDVGLINKLLMKVGVAPVPWLTDPEDRDAGDRGDGHVEERRILRDHLPGGTPVHRAQLPGGHRAGRRDVVAAVQVPHASVAPAADDSGGDALDDQRISALHRALRDDGRRPLRRTYSVVLYLYNNAFSYQKMGYAATIGVALALIIGAVVFVQRRVIGRAEAL